ncbi:uncharacterized protein METZ01_LOCUS161106, partial [marine metagenome]
MPVSPCQSRGISPIPGVAGLNSESSSKSYVLIIKRKTVDATRRRGNPTSNPPRLNDGFHKTGNKGSVMGTRQPPAILFGPFFCTEWHTLGSHMTTSENTYTTIKRNMGERESLCN